MRLPIWPAVAWLGFCSGRFVGSRSIFLTRYFHLSRNKSTSIDYRIPDSRSIRVSALMHEMRPLLRRAQIILPSRQHPATGSSGSILHPCPATRRSCHYWPKAGGLFQTFCRAVHSPARAMNHRCFSTVMIAQQCVESASLHSTRRRSSMMRASAQLKHFWLHRASVSSLFFWLARHLDNRHIRTPHASAVHISTNDVESSRSRNIEFDFVENEAYLGLVAFFVHPSPALYSPAKRPLPFTYSVEVFPFSSREVEVSWSVATCFFWSGILSISFPHLLARKGTVGAFRLWCKSTQMIICH
jgi:hypothetical protein